MQYIFILLLFFVSIANATDCGEYLKISEQEDENIERGSFLSDAMDIERNMYNDAYEKVKNNEYVKTYDELINELSAINNTKRDQKFKRALRVEKLYTSMSYEDAVTSVCNQNHKQSLSSVIIQANKQLIKVMRKNLGYLKAQEYALEGVEQDPATYATLCHQRKNNAPAYVATAKYGKKSKVFVTRGWKILHKGECISYDKHTYTYISWHKPDGRASPPRLYQTMPQGEFCIRNKDSFTTLGKAREADCKRMGGHLEIFLKLGMNSETLQ